MRSADSLLLSYIDRVTSSLEETKRLEFLSRNKIVGLIPHRDSSEHLRVSRECIAVVEELRTLLEGRSVSWCVFKTRHRIDSMPSDVDILLGGSSQVKEIARLLSDCGYRLLNRSRSLATLVHPRYGTVVDLYSELSVADWVYCDRKAVESEVIDVELKGIVVPGLAPAAEALVVALHAVFKEQIIGLSDFIPLEDVAVSRQFQMRLYELAEITYSKRALGLFLGVWLSTVDPYDRAGFGAGLRDHDENTYRLVARLRKRLSRKDLIPPLRVVTSTQLYFASAEKILGSRESRKTLASIAANLNPFDSKARDYIAQLIEHYRRDSY